MLACSAIERAASLNLRLQAIDLASQARKGTTAVRTYLFTTVPDGSKGDTQR